MKRNLSSGPNFKHIKLEANKRPVYFPWNEKSSGTWKGIWLESYGHRDLRKRSMDSALILGKQHI